MTEMPGWVSPKYAVAWIFTDSIACTHSFEIPAGCEYKLESFNSGYQIFADFSMKVKNSVDGDFSDISGIWNGVIYTTNKLIVTNEKNDTISFKETMIHYSL